MRAPAILRGFFIVAILFLIWGFVYSRFYIIKEE